MTAVSVMTPELIYLFYASDMVGATLNLVDPRYSPEGIHEYIEEAGSRMLICMNLFYDKCHQATRRTTVEKVLVFSPAESLGGAMKLAYTAANPDRNRYASNVMFWKQFMAAGKGASTASEPFDPNHSCVMVHTGGTTGSPKGVLLGDTSFNALAQQFAAYEVVFQRQQKLLNVMPPSSPTAMPAASTCPCRWASRWSSSPTSTLLSWASWCSSTSPPICSACRPTTRCWPPTPS